MNLTEQIEKAGSDHLPTFGGTFEGGYYIQQNPAELADLIRAMNGRQINSYLQIGSAAGGTERFLCEQVGIFDLTIIDDGQHSKFRIWTDVNKSALEAQGVQVSEYIGSSHNPAAKFFLESLGKTFDLIGIDGDHSPAGVDMDWKLIERFSKPGTLVWFHDISGNLLPPEMQGGRQSWDMVSKLHKVIFETRRHCGIGVLEII
jgi:predicted O-methyltransferase YrrM